MQLKDPVTLTSFVILQKKKKQKIAKKRTATTSITVRFVPVTLHAFFKSMFFQRLPEIQITMALYSCSLPFCKTTATNSLHDDAH